MYIFHNVILLLQLNEETVKKLLREVNISKKEQLVKLEESGFDKQRLINKEKEKLRRKWYVLCIYFIT